MPASMNSYMDSCNTASLCKQIYTACTIRVHQIIGEHMPEEKDGKSMYMKCFYFGENGLCNMIVSSPTACTHCMNWRSVDASLKEKYNVNDVFIEMYDLLSKDKRYAGFKH